MRLTILLDKYLSRNISYLISTILGLIIGTVFKEQGVLLGSIGRLFLNVLLVSITPFLACLFIVSIMEARKSNFDLSYLRITIAFFLVLIFSCAIGVGTSLILQPGANFSLSNTDHLKSIIELASQHSMTISTPIDSNISNGILKIISEAIPTNIYIAFQKNISFQITLFSIIFGITVGSNPARFTGLITVIKELQLVFEKIVKKTVHYLPLIIIFLSAEQFSKTGATNLLAMVDFFLKFLIAASILLIFSIIIIKFKTKVKFLDLWDIMLQPTIITICSQTPFPAVPATIVAMRRLGYNAAHLNMFVPFAATFAKYDNAIYMGFCSIFALQVYGFDYNSFEYAAIMGFICIVSISTAGQGNRSAVTELPVILKTLSVPSSALVPLILAIEFIMSPLRLILSLYINCAAISLMDKSNGKTLTLLEIQNEDDKNILINN